MLAQIAGCFQDATVILHSVVQVPLALLATGKQLLHVLLGSYQECAMLPFRFHYHLPKEICSCTCWFLVTMQQSPSVHLESVA
uniref:Uncharacterized protein n=1 Tax=Arundo donax TaxID=35708 RepID=A0A0A9GK35_ARUDO